LIWVVGRFDMGWVLTAFCFLFCPLLKGFHHKTDQREGHNPFDPFCNKNKKAVKAPLLL